ncbi:MAG: cytochrome C oxidase subunit IV family protein [Vicinamibacterales bacterium]
MAHGHEDIRKHIRVYISVFVALMVLTIITVGVAQLHLPIGLAVTVALAVATIKGSLVALFFMHLSNERRAIYAALALTVVFFVFLLAIPKWTENDQFGDKIERKAPAATEHAH